VTRDPTNRGWWWWWRWW